MTHRDTRRNVSSVRHKLIAAFFWVGVPILNRQFPARRFTGLSTVLVLEPNSPEVHPQRPHGRRRNLHVPPGSIGRRFCRGSDVWIQSHVHGILLPQHSEERVEDDFAPCLLDLEGCEGSHAAVAESHQVRIVIGPALRALPPS